ncbi:MAG: CDP-diacylglycerol--glycerol-3-phosphate 3-phosphatidyltransferase [Defluviitaleaceae bacterium]|nr:CDP-diacylglycerol--glycerol-3-phosphate 3-phosphatidyltransferase [Defluviitaleaceae bacterium]
MAFNIPNFLIIIRIVLIPVFLVAFFLSDIGTIRWAATLIFSVASITDYFDGLLARKWGTLSNFGKLMDPLADKMLVSAAMVALVYRQELAAWVVIVIISREFWVTAIRMLALEQGKEVIAATMWGKLKTTLQMTMIIVYLIGLTSPLINIGTWSIIVPLGEFLAYLTVIATIVSAVIYTFNAKDVFLAKG